VQTLTSRLAGENVIITVKSDWHTLIDDDHILLAENEQSIENAQNVDGVLINIFQPHVEDYQGLAQTDNPALDLLRYIVDRPVYVGNAHLIAPHGFMWGDQYAAFYTLANTKNHYILVIAVYVEAIDDVIVININVPEVESEQLRTTLINGIQSIVIGDVELTGDHLRALPEPILFPSGDVEIATDNTPQAP